MSSSLWALVLAGCTTVRSGGSPVAPLPREEARVVERVARTIEALTADKQVLTLQVEVAFWPVQQQADARWVVPLLETTVRERVAQQAVGDLLTTASRVQLLDDLNAEMSLRLAERGFELGDVAVRDLKPSPEVAEHIRRRQEAEQEAARLQAEAEALRRRAEADAR
ncbi:MAG: hypothetical protein KTR31_26680 [Myxococcales bacterium]|nr:hypothetical protein [Myxococcales bacterium]